MNEDLFFWLLNWYNSQCNGDWEHSYGITIGTLDNPGWSVNINLQETSYENKSFEKITIERSENDWVHCFVKDKVFNGFCGPLNLSEVLHNFRNWIENGEKQSLMEVPNQEKFFTKWEVVKRFDGEGGDLHWNRVLKKDIQTPHIHESACPGGTRAAELWEIPK